MHTLSVYISLFILLDTHKEERLTEAINMAALVGKMNYIE